MRLCVCVCVNILVADRHTCIWHLAPLNSNKSLIARHVCVWYYNDARLCVSIGVCFCRLIGFDKKVGDHNSLTRVFAFGLLFIYVLRGVLILNARRQSRTYVQCEISYHNMLLFKVASFARGSLCATRSHLTV